MKKVTHSLAQFLAKHPRWIIGLAVVYVLVPIDAIPEALVGAFGLVDDAIVLAVGILAANLFSKRKSVQEPNVVETTADDPSRRSQ